MGSISKLESGKYRAFARANNKRKTKVFSRRGDARAWLERTEQELGVRIDKSLHDAFDRYKERHSASKKGARWEIVRLERFKREISNQPITAVTRSTIADWRDERLKSVSGASVRRDMNLLSSVFNKCLYEWEWISFNPLKGVSRPPAPNHRERLLSGQEIEILARELPQTASLAFQLALETGMRMGEICNIKPENVNGKALSIPETKTGVPREIPLSKAALEILKTAGYSFNINPQTLSSTFYRVSKRLGISATFHDSRHNFCTKAASKVTVLELAKILGHKNINQLMTYYNPDPEDLADKLDFE